MFEYVFAVAGLCSPTPDMSVMTTRHAHCTRVRRQTASRASGAHKKVTALSAPVCETLPVLAVAGAVLAGAASDGASEVAGRFTRGIVERIALNRRFCGLARRLLGLRTPKLKGDRIGVAMRHRVPRRVLDYRDQKSAFSVSKGGSRVVRSSALPCVWGREGR